MIPQSREASSLIEVEVEEPGKICRIDDSASPAKRLTEMFHVVNRIIPDEQEIISVHPDTPAREAIQIMRDNGFSQLPVKEGESVLGLFTYRAFALEVSECATGKGDVASLLEAVNQN